MSDYERRRKANSHRPTRLNSGGQAGSIDNYLARSAKLPKGLYIIKYSLDFLRPIATAEAFEAVDWLADLPQQTWPQAGRSSDVILTSFC